MSVDITFDEFTRHVHANRTAGSSESLTDALMSSLRLIKPQLYAAATEHIDPRKPPYHLTRWLGFVRNNWSAYDRPRREA